MMEEKFWHKNYDFNIPTSIRYPNVPVHELVNIAASIFPNKVAFNIYGSELTFWQVREQVLRMANALIKIGIKKGDRVAVHLPNCPQYAIAYYATMAVGAIVVNLNPMYTAQELIAINKNTGTTAMFTFDMVMANIKALAAEVNISNMIVTRVTIMLEILTSAARALILAITISKVNMAVVPVFLLMAMSSWAVYMGFRLTTMAPTAMVA